MADRSTHELELALAEALSARDEALSRLADARAELNAVRLLQQYPGEPPPGEWSSGVGREALPLRYRLADTLNDAAKRLFGPAHSVAKDLASGRRSR